MVWRRHLYLYLAIPESNFSCGKKRKIKKTIPILNDVTHFYRMTFFHRIEKKNNILMLNRVGLINDVLKE